MDYLQREYTEGILQAGGIPVMIPIIDDENARQVLMKRLDGLVLTGGSDIMPRHYGAELGMGWVRLMMTGM